MKPLSNQGSTSVVAAFGLLLVAVCLAVMIRTANILERRSQTQELADRTAYEIARYQALILNVGAVTNAALAISGGLAAGTFGLGHLTGLVLDLLIVTLPEGIEVHNLTQEIVQHLQELNRNIAQLQDPFVDFVPWVPAAVVFGENAKAREKKLRLTALHYPPFPPFDTLESLSVNLPTDDRGVSLDFSLLLKTFIQPVAQKDISTHAKKNETAQAFKQNQVLGFYLPLLLHPDFGKSFQIATLSCPEDCKSLASLPKRLDFLATLSRLKLAVAQAHAYSPTQVRGGNWLVPDFEPRLTPVTVLRNANTSPEDLWYVWH